MLPDKLHAEKTLEAALASRQLILITGKGGTGKSTLTAALAQMAARRCGRALAVEFSSHPRLPELVESGCGVATLNIEAEERVGEALGRLLHLPGLVTATLSNRVLRLFIRTSPAVREMVALDELSFRVAQAARQGVPVVADLPSTGHALSFLETPRAVHRMLRVGPLAQVAKRVEQLVLDPSRCELVAVTLPEELPVNETLELLQRLRAAGVASRTVVVNQMPEAMLKTEDHPLLDALQDSSEGSLAHFAGAARRDAHGEKQARALIDRMRGQIDARILEVPHSDLADARARVQAVIRALTP